MQHFVLDSSALPLLSTFRQGDAVFQECRATEFIIEVGGMEASGLHLQICFGDSYARCQPSIKEYQALHSSVQVAVEQETANPGPARRTPDSLLCIAAGRGGLAAIRSPQAGRTAV